jgi:hypothetical protein
MFYFSRMNIILRKCWGILFNVFEKPYLANSICKDVFTAYIAEVAN